MPVDRCTTGSAPTTARHSLAQMLLRLLFFFHFFGFCLSSISIQEGISGNFSVTFSGPLYVTIHNSPTCSTRWKLHIKKGVSIQSQLRWVFFYYYSSVFTTLHCTSLLPENSLQWKSFLSLWILSKLQSYWVMWSRVNWRSNGPQSVQTRETPKHLLCVLGCLWQNKNWIQELVPNPIHCHVAVVAVDCVVYLACWQAGWWNKWHRAKRALTEQNRNTYIHPPRWGTVK